MLINKKVNETKEKLGVFLGTFDPIHNGHMHIARSVILSIGLDSVIIVPSYESPHKGESVCSSAKERMMMCNLACDGENLILASDIEIKNKLKGYSLKKIDLIAASNPQSKLYYIIGSDAYLTIMEWRNLEELISKVAFCVVVRDKTDTNKVEKIKKELKLLGGETYICSFATLDISSTSIRKIIRSNETISGLLPQNVEKFILENKLYLY
ncbi:MAG: nicotinate-nucleotide adenylyltransferase [Acidaminobacteraceae bacterium]